MRANHMHMGIIVIENEIVHKITIMACEQIQTFYLYAWLFFALFSLISQTIQCQHNAFEQKKQVSIH